MLLHAIVPAAGLSTRTGSTTDGSARKQMLMFRGAPVVVHTLRRLAASPEIGKIWVAARPEDLPLLREHLGRESLGAPVELLEGGETRQESVAAALRRVPEEVPFVLIHDAVRPFLEPELVSRALAAAEQHGAAIVAVPAVDTIKQVERGGAEGARVAATLPREKLVLAQTPQVFRHDWLREAFARAERENFHASDESGLIEHSGRAVFVVPGAARNWKITTAADLELAELFLGRRDAARS